MGIIGVLIEVYETVTRGKLVAQGEGSDRLVECALRLVLARMRPLMDTVGMG